MFFTWSLGNFIYAIMASDSARLKKHTVVVTILNFVLAFGCLGLVMVQPEIRTQIKEAFQRLRSGTSQPSNATQNNLGPLPLDEAQSELLQTLNQAIQNKDLSSLKNLYVPKSLECINEENRYYADKHFQEILNRPITELERSTIEPATPAFYQGNLYPVVPSHKLQYSWKSEFKGGVSQIPVIQHESKWQIVYFCPNPMTIKNDKERMMKVKEMSKKKVGPIAQGIKGTVTINGRKIDLKTVIAFWDPTDFKLSLNLFGRKMTPNQLTAAIKRGKQAMPVLDQKKPELLVNVKFNDGTQVGNLENVSNYNIVYYKKDGRSISLSCVPGQNEQEKVLGFGGSFQNGNRIKGLFEGNRITTFKEGPEDIKWNFKFNTVVQLVDSDALKYGTMTINGKTYGK